VSKTWRDLKTSCQANGRHASLAAVALSLTLTACSSWELPEFKKPDLTFYSPELNVFTPKETAAAVTGNDLIAADGHCAGDAPASQALNFQAGPQVGNTANGAAAAIPSPEAKSIGHGVALNMTECDVIRAIGPTNQIEVATNERGQRSVVLTYPQGERSGVYRFVGGRLVSIERGPDAPAPAKVKAKKPPPKPANS
jgi:hypothetical protein